VDTSELNAIARRCLDYIDSGTTAMADQPLVLDATTYTDETLWRQEKEQLFRKGPTLICLGCEIPNPGDFKTHEETGVPMIVVRDQNGEVHAFLNACRHRGARLEDVPCGHKERFTCPYHAWTYELSGQLKTVFKEETFGHIDKANHGLIRLPVQEKYGFVYVNPDPEGHVDIDAILGDLGPQLGGWNLADAQFIRSKELRVRTNWKLALDTFCEGYHFGPLHKDSVGLTSMTNLMTYDRYRYNHRLGFPTKSIVELKSQPESQWDAFAHLTFVHFLFPNISLLVSRDSVYMFHLYPGEKVDEHITRYHLYSRKRLTTEAELAAANQQFDYIYSIVENEDYWVSRNVMKSFKSRLHPYSIFGRNEPSLINMHRAFRESIGRDPEEIVFNPQKRAGAPQKRAGAA
jgi:carnitine monooxygenase subunit